MDTAGGLNQKSNVISINTETNKMNSLYKESNEQTVLGAACL
jgi:hypothetical protein